MYAEISGQYFGAVAERHPDRVLNVGIREQLLVSVGAGLALAGMRPIVHTFGSFLTERPFEQIKLDFVHQGVGGVLVGSGGSFDIAAGGRTHQSPGDVALLDTLPDVAVHVPGHAAEVDAAIRASVAAGGLHYVRVVGQTNERLPAPARPVPRRAPGARGAVVVAVGPQLDAVLAATAHRPVTVLYANTVRPFDRRGLAAVADAPEVTWWSRISPEPPPTRCPRRWKRSRTGCCPSAWAGPSCAGTARRGSTSPRTGWTPPASGRPSTASWLPRRTVGRSPPGAADPPLDPFGNAYRVDGAHLPGMARMAGHGRAEDHLLHYRRWHDFQRGQREG